jgi:hypothetical protein
MGWWRAGPLPRHFHLRGHRSQGRHTRRRAPRRRVSRGWYEGAWLSRDCASGASHAAWSAPPRMTCINASPDHGDNAGAPVVSGSTLSASGELVNRRSEPRPCVGAPSTRVFPLDGATSAVSRLGAVTLLPGLGGRQDLGHDVDELALQVSLYETLTPRRTSARRSSLLSETASSRRGGQRSNPATPGVLRLVRCSSP